jgi:hypothetical protein
MQMRNKFKSNLEFIFLIVGFSPKTYRHLFMKESSFHHVGIDETPIKPPSSLLWKGWEGYSVKENYGSKEKDLLTSRGARKCC